MKLKSVSALILSYLLCTAPAKALQCPEIVPDEAYEAAARVVIVRLDTIQSVADSETKFSLSLDVLDTLKGPSSEKIELALEETPWVRRSHFVTGVKYLWFLNADQTEINICELALVLEGRAAQWYASQ